MIVGILETGHANIKSLSNAIERMGHTVSNVSNQQEIRSVDKLVLPGVGAYPAVMAELLNNDLVSEIIKFSSSKALLGICLGMQLMMESSTEHCFTKGLALVKGTVNLLPSSLGLVPHVGWNEIFSNYESGLMTNIKDNSNVYFVHSYHCEVTEEIEIIHTDFYGQNIVAGFQKENIFGVQFHPEKSQNVGNSILKNFLDYA